MQGWAVATTPLGPHTQGTSRAPRQIMQRSRESTHEDTRHGSRLTASRSRQRAETESALCLVLRSRVPVPR